MRDIYILVLKVFGTANILTGLLTLAAAQFVYFGDLMFVDELGSLYPSADMTFMGERVFGEQAGLAMQQQLEDMSSKTYLFLSIFAVLFILLGIFISRRDNLFVRLQYGLARRPYDRGSVPGPSAGQTSAPATGASPDYSRYAPPEPR